MPDKTLRFAIVGAGYFAPYQLAAWQEVPGVECVAIADRIGEKAVALARDFGVPAHYNDARRLLSGEQPDFVDIVTDVASHAELVELAAEHRVAAICQKPLATSVAEAERMAAACRTAGVPFLVHENWRWQSPIRQVKHVLDSHAIGRPFRATIDMITGFPVFKNQPYFRSLAQFILADMGSHILDVARFLFGETESLHCRTGRVHADIAGEDVATVVLDCGGQTTVICRMAYAENALANECFPQTLIFVEGTRGSLELAPDYWVRTTTPDGTRAEQFTPRVYPWSEPLRAVVDESIVECHANLARALRGEVAAETNIDDNLRTVRLVFGCYESAASGEVWRDKKPGR